MRHFVLQRFVRLALYATLARCALACGADTDHGPPIGSPTGPIGPVVSEAGSSASAGQAGNNTGGASIGTSPDFGGAFNSATGGSAFGAGGSGSAGRDQFGVGGSGPSTDPFGAGGSVTASFGGSPF